MIRLRARRQRLYTLGFSADGRFLAGAGAGKTVTVWDVRTPGARSRRFSAGEEALRYVLLGFLRDGRVVGVTGGERSVVLSDPAYRRADPVPGAPPASFAAALSPDRSRVYTVAKRMRCLQLDPDPAEVWSTEPPDPGGSFLQVCVSPDGARLAACCFVPGGGPLVVVGWDAATGRSQGLIGTTTAPFYEMLWSADGRHILARRVWDLVVWDAATGRQLPGPRKNLAELPVRCLAFHPGGRVLAAGGPDGQVHLVDADAWQVVRTLQWDVGHVGAVAFAPDGLTAAAGGSETILVWDVAE